MANTSGLCYSFKNELVAGVHAFSTSVTRAGTTADSFKGALYQTTANLSPSTTSAYSATNEVSSAGYTAGGSAVVWTVSQTSGTTNMVPNASLSWTSVTFTTDALLVYNATQSNKAVGIFTFSTQTVTAGNFTLTMPASLISLT